MNFGDAEHAFTVTEGRQPEIRDGIQWLTYDHLPDKLKRYSEVFYQAAVDMLNRITVDSPELIAALNRLLEAKDSAVRAGIRNDTGRAGSVPRPQNVVAPPQLSRPARLLGCSHGFAWGNNDGHVCGEMPSKDSHVVS